jgi:hypothetical protein
MTIECRNRPERLAGRLWRWLARQGWRCILNWKTAVLAALAALAVVLEELENDG